VEVVEASALFPVRFEDDATAKARAKLKQKLQTTKDKQTAGGKAKPPLSSALSIKPSADASKPELKPTTPSAKAAAAAGAGAGAASPPKSPSAAAAAAAAAQSGAGLSSPMPGAKNKDKKVSSLRHLQPAVR
jgi:hypothetical protein